MTKFNKGNGMLIAIDAVGIRGHGGAAVLIELMHWLPIVRPEWRWHVFLLDRPLREFDDPPVSEQVTLEHTSSGHSTVGRLFWINRLLPERLQEIKADVLFSFANIAPALSRIPQVVFCHQRLAFFSEGLPFLAFMIKARMLYMRHHILRGANASQGMIVQTETMRARILELAPRLEERVHVIPSGYRTSSPIPVIRSEKKELIDRASQLRLIYPSHPSEHKNYLGLIRAMPEIIKTIPDISLLLTLERERPVNKRYSKFIHAISKEAVRLGVSKNLVWLGILSSDEIEYALRHSDLTVFPSLAESFGLPLVESMAAGCLVAAADLPYAHNVCENSAAYFNPKDPKSIARTVLQVCSDQNLADELRASETERKERFSYRKISESIAAVLEKSCGSSKAISPGKIIQTV